MIGVYVVDDRELLRRGLRAAIAETADLHVVGEAADPAVARLEIGALDPDVIVVDFDGGGADVLELCELVSAEPHPIPVIVSLGRTDRSRIRDAALAGAAGHVVVTHPVDEIVEAIRGAHAAPPTLGSDLVGDLFDRLRSGHSHPRHPLADLTDREREIMSLLADGLDNRRIGDALHLSPKTVKNYVSAILKKLGMGSRTEAAVFAAREAVRAEAAT